jgi:hypothetical protein
MPKILAAIVSREPVSDSLSRCTLREKMCSVSSRTQSRAFSDDATSFVILRPAPLSQGGRRISPAVPWRARDAESELLFRAFSTRRRRSTCANQSS